MMNWVLVGGGGEGLNDKRAIEIKQKINMTIKKWENVLK